MARIRSIKPEFWSDEKVVELEYEWRLLFQGLWNFADDQGYIDYSPKRIKMQVFPGDSLEVSVGLQRLHDKGLIVGYSSPIGDVLHIVNWERHQRVSNPAKPRFNLSDLHEYDGLPDRVQSPLESSRVLGKGREGKGKELSINPASNGKVSSADADGLFEKFWDVVPKKVGKKAARRRWDKAVKEIKPDTIIAAMSAYAASVGNHDPKFIVHPETWLNQGRWDDELPATPPPGSNESWWDN